MASDEIAALVATVAQSLKLREREVSDLLSEVIARDVAYLDGDPHMTEMLFASVEGNINTIFHVLGNDIPMEHLQPTTAAVEYALRLAQRGIPGNSLRRAYHLGQDELLELCFAEVQALDCAVELKAQVLHRVTRSVNRYIDWITQYVLETYDNERQRWITASGNVRSSLIHKVLTEQPVSAAEFFAETGYRLQQAHVGAVLWMPDDYTSDDAVLVLERFVREIGARLKLRSMPIFTAVDRSTAWAWFPRDGVNEPFDMGVVRPFAARTSVQIAIGLPARDLAGFRRTHEQAAAARVVALESADPAPHAVSYGDQGVAIVSVLARDLESTRKWVREVLGPLANGGEQASRLRETLHTFMSTGGSYTQSAALLDLHRNSVKYRVEKAMEKRGRPIKDDRLDVELALQVCHFLGRRVLTAATP